MGIDPETVDLSVYDFYSFESLDDLLRFYARHGDELCKKLVSYSDDSYSSGNYNVEYMAHEYRKYLESLEQKTSLEDLEEIKVKVSELDKQLFLLSDKLDRLLQTTATTTVPNNILQQLQQLQGEVMALKQKSSKDLENVIENVISKVVNEVNGIKMQLEQLKPKPNVQTTLFSHGLFRGGHEKEHEKE
ncbi:MAG: hypothetical protein QXD35_03320, partial [Nitrososphaerota archaeon]